MLFQNEFLIISGYDCLKKIHYELKNTLDSVLIAILCDTPANVGLWILSTCEYINKFLCM